MRLLLWAAAKALGFDRKPPDLPPALMFPPAVRPARPVPVVPARPPRLTRAARARRTPVPALLPTWPAQSGIATYPGTDAGVVVWFQEPTPVPDRIVVGTGRG